MKRLRLLVIAVLALPAFPARVEAHHDAADALKQDMRKLWTDHVVWTPDYLIAAVGDQPDAQCSKSTSRHILMMSDALSDGIVKQFPNKLEGGVTRQLVRSSATEGRPKGRPLPNNLGCRRASRPASM